MLANRNIDRDNCRYRSELRRQQVNKANILKQLESSCNQAQGSAIRHILKSLKLSDEMARQIGRIVEEGPPWDHALARLVVLCPNSELEESLFRILDEGSDADQTAILYHIGGWKSVYPRYEAIAPRLHQILINLSQSNNPVVAFDAALQLKYLFDDSNAMSAAARAIALEDQVGIQVDLYRKLREDSFLLPKDIRDAINRHLAILKVSPLGDSPSN